MKKYAPLVLIILLFFSCAASDSEARVKQSNLAGSWYPADTGELSGQIDRLLTGARAPGEHKDPLVLILPHAGYVYSGKTAAAGYRVIGTVGKARHKHEADSYPGPYPLQLLPRMFPSGRGLL